MERCVLQTVSPGWLVNFAFQSIEHTAGSKASGPYVRRTYAVSLREEETGMRRASTLKRALIT